MKVLDLHLHPQIHDCCSGFVSHGKHQKNYSNCLRGSERVRMKVKTEKIQF